MFIRLQISQQKLVVTTQEPKLMEQGINILNTLNIGSTGEVTEISIMNLDSFPGLYVTGLIKNKCQLVQEERDKQMPQRMEDKSPTDEKTLQNMFFCENTACI